MRAALFAQITQLEMTMKDAIRREFRETDRWKERLSEHRRQKIETERSNVAADDNLVDDLLFTQFADKITIIRKSPDFTASKRKFENELSEAERLRDSLAHANDYAATHESAARVCAIVRNLEHRISRLSAWPPEHSAAKQEM